MSRRTAAALLVLPSIALASVAEASALCDQLSARLAQMPQVIGATEQANAKARSTFRLNELERAVRHDMRRMQCPSDSVITIGADNQSECDGLREELSGIRQQLAELESFEPTLTHTIDDGSGLSTSLVRQMQAAGCSIKGSQMDVEVIGGNDNQAPVTRIEVSAADTGTMSDDQQLAALFRQDTEQDYGVPEDYGMIDLTSRDADPSEQPVARFVPLPDMKSETLRPQLQPKSPQVVTLEQPQILRDYDPNDKKVRRVGPAFLPDQEQAIDLRHPQDAPAAN